MKTNNNFINIFSTIIIFVFSLGYYKTYSNTISQSNQLFLKKLYIDNDSLFITSLKNDTIKNKIKKEKLMAILLAIMLGPFGMHRLYLGCNDKIPIFYTLTLGGGLGILPLIDIVVILIERKIDKIKNNNKIFMWAK